ncbi:hypothetical protein RQP53_19600 [Paucibacter sp. APW11]|uniref:Uncharacterized protein n=1 Tax=Roseateles aquae TaxID=3077235 RepID=A0ABU3PFZ1_9BURK|nr:hypothetical protein [Paucibacter sp. APW11]MDT9001491.1 hypothetical protein [Paucibacter sp. APW11]
MDKPIEAALREGLADAIGFVGGALAGWQLAALLGLDFINTPGWALPQIAGLALMLVVAGVARWLMRRLLIKPV